MRKPWKYAAAMITGMLALSAAASEMRWQAGATAVEIVDRSDGRVLPVYDYAGRHYVVGKPGDEYLIRVRNTGSDRVLAVMSVDGVNVISGDTAATTQSGYVLSPYGSYDIAGWRKSMSRTAAFYFTALPDSYASRTRRPENVGVIGVAVFHERARPPVAIPYGQMNRKDAARLEADTATAGAADAASPAATPAPAQRAFAEQARSKLGTGHGRNEESRTEYADFTRASDTPSETIAIYYDSYENLLAQGVPVRMPPLARLQPDPFPDRGRFAPDPQ